MICYETLALATELNTEQQELKSNHHHHHVNGRQVNKLGPRGTDAVVSQPSAHTKASEMNLQLLQRCTNPNGALHLTLNSSAGSHGWQYKCARTVVCYLYYIIDFISLQPFIFSSSGSFNKFLE